MKSISILASLLVLSPLFLPADEVKETTPSVESKKEPQPSTLTFADQTRITGFPKTINGANRQLTLESSSLDGSATLKTDRLIEMTLDGTPPKLESDHYAIATIKKHYQQDYHDSIRGRLIQLDDKKIILDTSYAGRLTLRRSLVKSLDIYNQSPSFYEGPAGPEGWVAASGDAAEHWDFKNRSMISKDRIGIAREVQIPKKAKITFTADWKTSPYFRILFFSDDGKRSYPNSGYSLNVQRSYLSLYRHVQNARNNDIISESIRSLYNAETATFTIYLDRDKSGTCAIYIDDEEIGTWTGIDDTKTKGDWLHFVPQNENAIRFSKISVAQWDGILPRKEAKEAEKGGDDPEQPAEQEISLANGDVVTGSVKSMEEGIAFLSTSFGDVKIPVRVMRGIDLATEKDEVKMESNDIRAWFHEGGYITLKLKSLDGKTIKGYSQAWGDAEFDLNAFSRIEFNIWRPELDAARYGTDSDW